MLHEHFPNLRTALAYAATGLAVLPLISRSKVPAIARGLQNATTNPATIARYVRVLDIDDDDGAARRTIA